MARGITIAELRRLGQEQVVPVWLDLGIPNSGRLLWWIGVPMLVAGGLLLGVQPTSGAPFYAVAVAMAGLMARFTLRPLKGFLFTDESVVVSEVEPSNSIVMFVSPPRELHLWRDGLRVRLTCRDAQGDTTLLYGLVGYDHQDALLEYLNRACLAAGVPFVEEER